MKLSFTTLGCPEWSIEDIIRNGKAYGFDGVELRTREDGKHFSPEASLDQATEVGQKFRDAGIGVSSVMGYPRFAHVDPAEVATNVALLDKLVDIAEAMHAPFVRTFAGRIPEDTEQSAMIEVVANAIRPVAKKAADKGVRIGLETHDDWCAGKVAMEVVNQVGSPGFGIVYDIFNSFGSGIEPWDVTYETVKEHICYCHLKDGYTGADGKTHYVMLGAGDLPIVDLLRRLKADGYDSYLSLEWEKMWHEELEEPERVFPHFVHKVKALWEAV